MLISANELLWRVLILLPQVWKIRQYFLASGALDKKVLTSEALNVGTSIIVIWVNGAFVKVMELGGKLVAIGTSQMMDATTTRRKPSCSIAGWMPQSGLLRRVYRVSTVPKFTGDSRTNLQKYCVNTTARDVRTQKPNMVAIIVAPAVT